MILKIKKTHPDAIFRTQGDDSGYDVCAIGVSNINYGKIEEPKFLNNVENSFAIEPGQRVLVKTGISLELPQPVKTKWGKIIVEAQARPKSSLSTKLALDVKLGTIDNPYRGECGITIKNDSPVTKIIKKGDKIAQIVFNRVVKFNEDHIIFTDDLSETERGSGGYGSTGGIPEHE